VTALARFLATGFYTGYVPLVPGTFGTLPGVVLAIPLAALWPASPAAYVLVLGVSIVVAVWSASSVVRQTGISDPQIIVVDEVVGYFLAMAFLPATAPMLFAAFVAFRLFDIVKPPPAPWLEGLPGGLGVVADDLYAGVLANLVVRAAALAGVL